jgi:ferrochelatase
MIHTQNLTTAVQNCLPEHHVDFAMRYGQPSVQSKLEEMREQGIDDVIVIPLYPQYSGSTNGSVFDAVGDALKKMRWVPNLQFVNSYYQSSDYTTAICHSIQQHWQRHGRNDLLIMSFHGVPKNYIEKGDPYHAQCVESANAIAKQLQLKEDEWKLVFQSRLGAQEWLKPYCDETLKSLPQQGTKSVDIICPGFSADCLETLEEIAQENCEYFMEAGGEKYSYIPCLNDSTEHAELFKNLVQMRA